MVSLTLPGSVQHIACTLNQRPHPPNWKVPEKEPRYWPGGQRETTCELAGEGRGGPPGAIQLDGRAGAGAGDAGSANRLSVAGRAHHRGKRSRRCGQRTARLVASKRRCPLWRTNRKECATRLHALSDLSCCGIKTKHTNPGPQPACPASGRSLNVIDADTAPLKPLIKRATSLCQAVRPAPQAHVERNTRRQWRPLQQTRAHAASQWPPHSACCAARLINLLRAGRWSVCCGEP